VTCGGGGGLLRFFGFLAGVTASCGAAYSFLAADIDRASSQIATAVNLVQADVQKVGAAVLHGHACAA
jgi:hypothetical protein